MASEAYAAKTENLKWVIDLVFNLRTSNFEAEVGKNAPACCYKDGSEAGNEWQN